MITTSMAFCKNTTLLSLSLMFSDVSSSGVYKPSRNFDAFMTLWIMSCRNRNGGFLSNFSCSGGFFITDPKRSCVFLITLGLISSSIAMYFDTFQLWVNGSLGRCA
uniref:Secreted protein n=1 Tax=Ixodes ricinus TaxID=34613 RepID=A0A6B0U952_IXORI